MQSAKGPSAPEGATVSLPSSMRCGPWWRRRSGPLGFLSVLLEFYGRDRPLSIVSLDGNPHAVKFVQPNILNRPGFSVGENDGFPDQFRLHVPECAEDGRCAELNNRHGFSPEVLASYSAGSWCI